MKDKVEAAPEKDYGQDIEWEVVPSPESYYPTRLEYFAGKALQGLVTGRSEKEVRTAVSKAIILALEMEDALDSAQG